MASGGGGRGVRADGVSDHSSGDEGGDMGLVIIVVGMRGVMLGQGTVGFKVGMGWGL